MPAMLLLNAQIGECSALPVVLHVGPTVGPQWPTVCGRCRSVLHLAGRSELVVDLLPATIT
eukprot:12179476-Prorocentrum_lima.AAC.1